MHANYASSKKKDALIADLQSNSPYTPVSEEPKQMHPSGHVAGFELCPAVSYTIARRTASERVRRLVVAAEFTACVVVFKRPFIRDAHRAALFFHLLMQHSTDAFNTRSKAIGLSACFSLCQVLVALSPFSLCLRTLLSSICSYQCDNR